MNYKRRSRRRDKRTMLPCGCCEDIRGGVGVPRIDESEICNGKSFSRRKPAKKSKCPTGGSHEWVHESVVERDREITHRAGYWDCEDCKAVQQKAKDEYLRYGGASKLARKMYPELFPSKVPWSVYYHLRCEYHTMVRTYTENVKRSLCVKCGSEKEKRGVRVYDDGNGRRYHGVKRHIPKRVPVC